MSPVATDKRIVARYAATQAHPGECYFSGLTEAEAAEALHEMLDWEGLMEEGTTPSLALGAERRLRRPG